MQLTKPRRSEAQRTEGTSLPRRVILFGEVHQRLRPDLCERAARVWVWRGVREGWFPPPLQLSPHRIAWEESSIETFIASRPRVRYAPAEAHGRPPG